MKQTLLLLSLLLPFTVFSMAPVSTVVTSPDGRLEVTVYLRNGVPCYCLKRLNKYIIKESVLGIKLKDKPDLVKDFVITDIKKSQFDEKWSPVLGEYSSVRNRYNDLTITIQEAGNLKRELILRFRVYNDGMGFRYEFPLQANLKYFVISSEQTQFNLTGDHKAFWIPGDYDSNEYPYTTSRISEIDAWKTPMISFGTREENIPDQYAVQTPLMMKTDDGLYINIHEAALVNYPAMQLHADRSLFSLSARLVPDAVGSKAYLRTPAVTPWRTVIVSDKAAEIPASTLILNLNEPSKIADVSWIKPMKYMGIWWEMQTGKSRWDYSYNVDARRAGGMLVPHGQHGASTANVKKYIDFASANQIGGLLIEGWNTGWEEWTGDWKEENFDYVTPYPDLDIRRISEYARQKGVQLIMHNETGGSATNYERRMDTAFRLMNRFGYPAVKTGYVGRIIPRGEHHDGQWMVNHYVRAAEKAAAYRVVINMHEPVRPTGLNRTYPNWVASEASRGNEWNAFSNGNAPEHETILPFTRLIGGPMDYTPGIFKLRHYAKDDSTRQVHSTLAKQLALYVTIYSPLQMAADLPENYEAHMDAFQFIKDVACDWDDTKYIEAEPGDYITVARKAKGTENWFVGAITDENSRMAIIPLSFLNRNTTYEATIYYDDDRANWKTNPEAYRIERVKVTSKSVIRKKMAGGGGLAISLKPVTPAS